MARSANMATKTSHFAANEAYPIFPQLKKGIGPFEIINVSTRIYIYNLEYINFNLGCLN